jgi:hypothetical protein
MVIAGLLRLVTVSCLPFALTAQTIPRVVQFDPPSGHLEVDGKDVTRPIPEAALGLGWYVLVEWLRHRPSLRDRGTAGLALSGTLVLFAGVVAGLVLEFLICAD